MPFNCIPIVLGGIMTWLQLTSKLSQNIFVVSKPSIIFKPSIQRTIFYVVSGEIIVTISSKSVITV